MKYTLFPGDPLNACKSLCLEVLFYYIKNYNLYITHNLGLVFQSNIFSGQHKLNNR